MYPFKKRLFWKPNDYRTRSIKRPFALLEVMIAFALVALCALPLVYPHVAIFKAEKQFLNDIELDHFVSLLYADTLEKLYLNEISWSTIHEGKEMIIDFTIMQSFGSKKPLPFKGTYKFVEIKHKPPKPKDKGVYLFDLIYEFVPIATKDGDESVKPLKYPYKVMIEQRNLGD